MHRRTVLTRASEERQRADNRRRESQRDEHMKMVAHDKLLRANLASDERVEKKIFIRRYGYSVRNLRDTLVLILFIRLQQEVQEEEMQLRIMEAAREKQARERQLQQEQQLAKAHTHTHTHTHTKFSIG